MEEPSLKDQMEYAMKHFTFIADQRLKTFHFYVILLVASLGAVLHLATDVKISIPGFLTAGAFNILLPIIFFVIERRNLHLLNVARWGVEAVERQANWPKHIRIALRDREKTRGKFIRLFSYRVAFALTFASQMAFGVALIFCALLVSHPASASSPESGRSAKINKTAKAKVSKKNPPSADNSPNVPNSPHGKGSTVD